MTNSPPWIGPQISTAAATPKTYLSNIAAHSSSNPTPMTYAATRYRRNAAMIFGGTAAAAGAVPEPLPDRGFGVSVSSPVGSTGTAAVLLGQGGQRPVVLGQFRVVLIILAHHRHRDDHGPARPLRVEAAAPAGGARWLLGRSIVGVGGPVVEGPAVGGPVGSGSRQVARLVVG